MAWNPSPLRRCISGRPADAACTACLSPLISDLGLAQLRTAARGAASGDAPSTHPVSTLVARVMPGPAPVWTPAALPNTWRPATPTSSTSTVASFIYVANLLLPLNATISHHRTLLHTFSCIGPRLPRSPLLAHSENNTQHLHSFFDFLFSDFGLQLSFFLAPAAPPTSLSSLRSLNLSPVSPFSLESLLESCPA